MRRKIFCTWTFSDERGLCSHSPLLSGPLHQPSDSGLLVAAPLFMLPTWIPGKFIFSQTTTSAGAAVASSVLWLTAFQLQASRPLCTVHSHRGCRLFSTVYLHLSLRHFDRTKPFKTAFNIHKHLCHMYSPGLILMFLLNVWSC